MFLIVSVKPAAGAVSVPGTPRAGALPRVSASAATSRSSASRYRWYGRYRKAPKKDLLDFTGAAGSAPIAS
jgi:hypothetical protein